MKRYLLTLDAEQDLDTVKTYLLKRGGVPAARHVLTQINLAFGLLADRPEAGHRREDLTPTALKFWPIFSYLIVYDPIPRPIVIVRVLHASRDIEALLHD